MSMIRCMKKRKDSVVNAGGGLCSGGYVSDPCRSSLRKRWRGGSVGNSTRCAPPDQHSRTACRSSLNNDGSPLQLCITSSSRGCSSRLIGDPGAFASTISERIERSRDAVLGLSAASRSATFDSLTNRILRMIVPENCTQIAEPDAGIMWLATGMHEAALPPT